MREHISSNFRKGLDMAIIGCDYLNRRQFFAITGLAGVTGGPRVLAAVESQRLFELGTITYNLGRNWDLDQLIRNCEEVDFKAVELRTTHRHGVEPELTDQQRTEVRRRFEQTDIELVCLGTTCEYHSPDQEEVRRQIELSGRFLELAADVGAEGIKVRPNGIPDSVPVETTLKQIGRSLLEVGEMADKYQVGVWVEVHGRRSNHPPYMKKMMDYCGHPMVGITWNCNEADLKNGDVKPYFDLLKSHIKNVHINNLTSGYPYREFFGLLREIKYDRYTLAEVAEAKGDPLRFMRYYRHLWDELSRAPNC
jgi:sugar phosphate isomerase/epimerase